MGLLNKIIQTTSEGEAATVAWSHLRSHLPGENDRVRWFAMSDWARKAQLFYAAEDLKISPTGEIAGVDVTFWCDTP
jgi:hypothetical protein